MRVSFFYLAIVPSIFILFHGARQSSAWAEEQHVSVVGQVFCMDVPKDATSTVTQNNASTKVPDNTPDTPKVGAVKILRKRRQTGGEESTQSQGQQPGSGPNPATQSGGQGSVSGGGGEQQQPAQDQGHNQDQGQGSAPGNGAGSEEGGTDNDEDGVYSPTDDEGGTEGAASSNDNKEGEMPSLRRQYQDSPPPQPQYVPPPPPPPQQEPPPPQVPFYVPSEVGYQQPPPPPPPQQYPAPQEPHVPQQPAPQPEQRYPQRRSGHAEQGQWYFVPGPSGEATRFRRSASGRNAFTPTFTPAKDVVIQLYERDTITPDDLLAETTTDENGFFNISGSDSEFNQIRPYLYISHTCPSIFPEYKNCKFRTKVELPYNVADDNGAERSMVLPLSGTSTEVECE